MASRTMSRQYYFAFGSNMWLTQMAERCPGSTFVGKATLHGYRWQINQRHVANIIKVDDENSNDVVEGLVFSITDTDRRTLDRKEGIKLGVYERVDVVVALQKDPKYENKKTAFVRKELEDRDFGKRKDSTATSKTLGGKNDDRSESMELDPANDQLGDPLDKSSRIVSDDVRPEESLPHPRIMGGKPTNAITYLSTKFNEDGLIREEYVQRMENAMHDAVRLGVSQEFLQKYLEPCVHGEISAPDEKKKDKQPAAIVLDDKEPPKRDMDESQTAKRPQPRDSASGPRRTEKKVRSTNFRAKQPRGQKTGNQVDGGNGKDTQSLEEGIQTTHGQRRSKVDSVEVDVQDDQAPDLPES